MTEREALLKAVCENPDDDTPRLVFADWLQEHGEEERAEFIRLQIALARGNYNPGESARLKQYELQLLLRARDWRHEVPGAEQVRYVRGLINHAYFSEVAGFLNALDRAPLRSVVISGPVDLVTVFKAVSTRRIEEIDLGNADVGKTHIAAFADTDKWHAPNRLILPWYLATNEIRERIRARFRGQVEFKPLFG